MNSLSKSPFSQPAADLIRKRRSCRSYSAQPIDAAQQRSLMEFIAALPAGPFQGGSRFELVATSGEDRSALQGLGTYGFIRGAPGFVIGACPKGGDGVNLPGELQDFGYRMEQIILYATQLDLGTCWLGGTFTRSSFAQKISLSPDEILPAVCAIGPAADQRVLFDRVARQLIGADRRRGWNELFFEGGSNIPLSAETTGAYAAALEMVRLGPSASNKQPWRIFKEGNTWHFYLKRASEEPGSIQYLDMGIAMFHFELTAVESGLKGAWVLAPPVINPIDPMMEYCMSWYPQ